MLKLMNTNFFSNFGFFFLDLCILVMKFLHWTGWKSQVVIPGTVMQSVASQPQEFDISPVPYFHEVLVNCLVRLAQEKVWLC